MTWAFVYSSILVLGLILALGFGVFESLPKNKTVAIPRAELARHSRQVHICQLGVVLTAFGIAALPLSFFSRWPWYTALLVGGAFGSVAWIVALLLLKVPCSPMVEGQKATVLKDIPPGGYGQVRIINGASETILAAQNGDPEPIPAGSEVEVVNTERSVVVVRRFRTS